MTWLNPWAFAGILALAIPVLIHLLGRRNARVQAFPTLRFLGESRAVSTSRTRLTDLSLLAIRMAILAAAVAALARPLVLTVQRRVEPYRTVVRAIVVDTSASMRRAIPTDTGPKTAIEWARGEGRRLAAETGESVLLETARPADVLAGAAAWLDTRHGPPSITVLSDFQRGSIDSTDVSVVPAHIGVMPRVVAVVKPSGPIEVVTIQRNAAVTAAITTSSDRTDVEWSRRGSGAEASPLGVAILAGAGERAAAEAAVAAATAFAIVPPTDTAHSIAIVHRQYEQRAQLLANARPLREPWHGDAVTRIARDATLLTAARDAEVLDDEPGGARFDSAAAGPFVVVARTRLGRPAVLAAADEADGRQRLLLLPRVAAGSLTSAALVGAALRATSPVVPAVELDPETLGVRYRPWTVSPGRLYRDGAGSSDGRWVWLIVLALLAIEWRMRRSRRQQPGVDVGHERAA